MFSSHSPLEFGLRSGIPTIEVVVPQSLADDEETVKMFIGACQYELCNWETVNTSGILELARVFKTSAIEDSVYSFLGQGSLFLKLQKYLAEGLDTHSILNEIGRLSPNVLEDEQLRGYLLVYPVNIVQTVMSSVMKYHDIPLPVFLQFVSEYTNARGREEGSFLLSLLKPHSLSDEDITALLNMNIDWEFVNGSVFTASFLDYILSQRKEIAHLNSDLSKMKRKCSRQEKCLEKSMSEIEEAKKSLEEMKDRYSKLEEESRSNIDSLSQALADVKAQCYALQRKLPIQIFIRKPDGTHIALDVMLTDTIAYVKEQINTRENIPSEIQLRYAGKILQNANRLEDYNIQKDSLIELHWIVSVEMMPIYVRRGEKQIKLVVSPSAKIEEVKTLIQQSESIPWDNQKLIFNHRILENGKTLSECGITKESYIELYVYEPPRQVYIKTLTGKMMTLNVAASDTIGHLKGMLRDIGGVEPAIQRLNFGGIELDDEKTLQDYSISNESTLLLVFKLRR